MTHEMKRPKRPKRLQKTQKSNETTAKEGQTLAAKDSPETMFMEETVHQWTLAKNKAFFTLCNSVRRLASGLKADKKNKRGGVEEKSAIEQNEQNKQHEQTHKKQNDQNDFKEIRKQTTQRDINRDIKCSGSRCIVMVTVWLGCSRV